MGRLKDFEIPEYIDTDNLIFLNIVGSHAQGAATEHSDIDYHGCHYLPTSELLTSFRKKPEEVGDIINDDDFSSHEVLRFMKLLSKSNCNALEDVFSPIVLHYDKKYFPELKNIAKECVTKNMYHCYHGIAARACRSLTLDNPKFHKICRNSFRPLLTGTYAFETGKIVLDYEFLKSEYSFEPRPDKDWMKDFNMLDKDLKWHMEHSNIPDEVSDETIEKIDNFILKIRKENW